MPDRASEVIFENVRVPADQVVGEVNRGWYVAVTLLDYERSANALAVRQRRTVNDLVVHLKASASPKYRASNAKLSRWQKKCFRGRKPVGMNPCARLIRWA